MVRYFGKCADGACGGDRTEGSPWCPDCNAYDRDRLPAAA